MRAVGGKGLRGAALLLPISLLLLVFYIVPVAEVLLRSFTVPQLGLQNYVALWQAPANVAMVRNSLSIAFWTTLLCLLIGYPYAYHICGLRPGLARVFVFLSFAPLFTALLARLYAWTVILGRHGIINDALLSVGLIDHPIGLLFSPPAVIVGTVHVLLPYMVMVLYSVMRGIDQGLLQASRTLGAGPAQTFWRVYLPLSMRGVYAGTLLVFIISLGFFITPAVLGSGEQLTMAVYIEQQVNILRWGTASAMAVALLVVTIVLFVLFDRMFGARRLIAGGTRK